MNVCFVCLRWPSKRLDQSPCNRDLENSPQSNPMHRKNVCPCIKNVFLTFFREIFFYRRGNRFPYYLFTSRCNEFQVWNNCPLPQPRNRPFSRIILQSICIDGCGSKAMLTRVLVCRTVKLFVWCALLRVLYPKSNIPSFLTSTTGEARHTFRSFSDWSTNNMIWCFDVMWWLDTAKHWSLSVGPIHLHHRCARSSKRINARRLLTRHTSQQTTQRPLTAITLLVRHWTAVWM